MKQRCGNLRHVQGARRGYCKKSKSRSRGGYLGMGGEWGGAVWGGATALEGSDGGKGLGLQRDTIS